MTNFKMTKTLLTLSFLLTCLSTFSQQNFFYNISVKPTKAKKLFVAYEIAGIKFIDSLNFEKKQYAINKKLSQPVAATLYTDDEKIKSLSVFLANNILQVNINETVITRINVLIICG